MTDTEKLTMLKAMTGEKDESVLSTYLSIAGNKVLKRAYPFDSTVTVVPDRYAYNQVEIAAYLVNKRGAEGETAHSENGISRSYEDGDVPPTLLREIVPCASLIWKGTGGMRVMERNKSAYWYLLYDRKEPVKNEEGHETGDTRVVYKEAVKRRDNVSAATGSAQVEQFGNFISYDKVIVTDDLTCPIDENTVLFIDKSPEYDDDGNPLYDYIVKRVARSLNSISYAVSKVTVS